MDQDTERVDACSSALQPSKGGRPTKLTPALQDRFVAAIKAGNFRETAARLAGISVATMYRWLAADSEPFLTFQVAVVQAEAELEAKALKVVTDRIPEDARLALAFLAKRFPERWGGGRPVAHGEPAAPAPTGHGSQFNVLVIEQNRLEAAARQHLEAHRARLAEGHDRTVSPVDGSDEGQGTWT
jgi:hypothetical protein